MAGITENGIDIKTFRQLITDIQNTLDEGDTGIVITDESNLVANNIANSIGMALAELWQFGEQVYDSGNVYKATGTSLDKLVTYRRLVRQPAEFSSGGVEMFCSGRTTVNQNTRFRDIRNRILICTESRVLGSSLFRTATVTLGNVVVGTRYYLVIAGTEYSYTAVINDTAQQVFAGIKASIDTNSNGTVTATVTPTSLSFNIVAIENATVQFHPDMVVGNFSSIVNARASETGVLNFPAQSVNALVNPIPTVISVSNPLTFTLGREQETDRELRMRFLRTPAATREATVDSIIRAVESVEGVTSANVINNPSTTTSPDGIPPHAFETIVDGGVDVDIANIIFQRAAAGIQSFGSTTVVVQDSKGTDHSIGFTRPSPSYIFFRVTYEPLSTGSVPSNVDNAIKDAIVEYSTTISAADDVIPSRFTVPIYNSVAGLGEVLVEAGSSPNQGDNAPVGGYSTDRIDIGIRQRSVIESSRITTVEGTLP